MIDYYETAERIVGDRTETQDFLRLFVIPGMDHCQGGPGAGFIDTLSALNDWVENDKAPDRLIGANVKYPSVVYGTTFPVSSLPHEQLHRDRRCMRKASTSPAPISPIRMWPGTRDQVMLNLPKALTVFRRVHDALIAGMFLACGFIDTASTETIRIGIQGLASIFLP